MGKKVCILSSVHIALDNRVFYREACSLQRAGYDVTLIAVHPRREIKDGVTIIGLPRLPRWQRPLLWREVYRLAVQSGADVYHFHDPELLPLGVLLRRRTGRPVIYDVHEAYPDFFAVKDYLPAAVRYPAAELFRFAEPNLARLQSALIFADDATADDFAAVDVPKITLFNFPGRHFVDSATAASGAYEARPPVVLYLGGMERNRGTALMVEAFARVRAALPQAQLWLVGHFMPPELQQEVQDAVAQHQLQDAVTITGRVDFEQIGAYLRQARVGWVPWQSVAKNEKNIPTKLFEYMAYGLPVVASDLRSIRPFVQEGQSGYLVPAADPAQHAASILDILRQPERGAAMGRQGQVLVRDSYNWEPMEQRLLQLYATIMAD